MLRKRLGFSGARHERIPAWQRTQPGFVGAGGRAPAQPCPPGQSLSPERCFGTHTGLFLDMVSNRYPRPGFFKCDSAELMGGREEMKVL